MQRPVKNLTSAILEAVEKAGVYFPDLKKVPLTEEGLAKITEICQDRLQDLLDNKASKQSAEVDAAQRLLRSIAAYHAIAHLHQNNPPAKAIATDLYRFLMDSGLGDEFTDRLLSEADLENNIHIAYSIRAIKKVALNYATEPAGFYEREKLQKLEKKYPQHPELLAALAEGHYAKDPIKSLAYLNTLLQKIPPAEKPGSSLKRRWLTLFELAPVMQTIELLKAWCLAEAEIEIDAWGSPYKAKTPASLAKEVLLELVCEGSLIAYQVLYSLDKTVAKNYLPQLLRKVSEEFQQAVAGPTSAAHAALLLRWQSFISYFPAPVYPKLEDEKAKQLEAIFKSKAIFLYRLAIHIQLAQSCRNGAHLPEGMLKMLSAILALDYRDFEQVANTFNLVEVTLASRLKETFNRAPQTLRFYMFWYAQLKEQETQKVVYTFSPYWAHKLLMHADAFTSLERVQVFLKIAERFPDNLIASSAQKVACYSELLRLLAPSSSARKAVFAALLQDNDVVALHLLNKFNDDLVGRNKAFSFDTYLKAAADKGSWQAQLDLADHYFNSENAPQGIKYYLLAFRNLCAGNTCSSVNDFYRNDTKTALANVQRSLSQRDGNDSVLKKVAEIEMLTVLEKHDHHFAEIKRNLVAQLSAYSPEVISETLASTLPRNRDKLNVSYLKDVFFSYQGLDITFAVRLSDAGCALGPLVPMYIGRWDPAASVGERYWSKAVTEITLLNKTLNQLTKDFAVNPVYHQQLAELKVMIFNTCDRQAIHHYNSIWFAQRWLPWYTEQVQQVFLQLSTFENLRSLLPDIEAKLVDSKTVMEFEQGLYYRLQQQIAAPVQQAGQRQGLFSQPALAKEDKPARRYSF